MTTTGSRTDTVLDDARRAAQFHAARASALRRVLPGVVHEVRGPLNGLTLNAELVSMSLSGEEGDPERARKHMGAVRDDLERFQEAFGRLVDLVVPSSGDRVGEVDLGEVISRVEALLGIQARHEQVELRLERPERVVLVHGRRRLLEQAVLGLAVNGLDGLVGAEGDKELRLILEVAGERARLTVADSGVGIVGEDLLRVFEPHFTRRAEAGGVGLPVSRFLVEAHGGTIHLDSEPGRGTTAYVELPVSTGGRDA